MEENEVNETDLRDGDREVDLRDRLRFAAGVLAADFGDDLTADSAEALVFSSAEGLLASASLTEFVPILAERRARLAVRSRTTTRAAAPDLPPAPPPSAAGPEPAAPSAADAPRATPLLALPEGRMSRLQDTLEQVRGRVTGWRAELDRR